MGHVLRKKKCFSLYLSGTDLLRPVLATPTAAGSEFRHVLTAGQTCEFTSLFTPHQVPGSGFQGPPLDSRVHPCAGLRGALQPRCNALPSQKGCCARGSWKPPLDPDES